MLISQKLVQRGGIGEQRGSRYLPAVTKGLKVQEEICHKTFEISYCGILSIKRTLISYQYLPSLIKKCNSCQNKLLQSGCLLI